MTMWQTYLQPTTVSETLALLQRHASPTTHLIAGGTDLLVELSQGRRTTATAIDISRVGELRAVRDEGDYLILGALVTHNDVIAAPAFTRAALPLVQACWEVGAPQIRTRATVAGNLVTASPANDTIAPLLALGARVVLASQSGERIVPLEAFYTGLRGTVLRPDELLREIRIPAMTAAQRGLFIKLGLRRAQAISVINVALVLTLDGARVSAARLALGCVAPTVVRLPQVEEFLCGRLLDPETCRAAGRLAVGEVSPIGDVRGSAAYRRSVVAALVTEALERLAVDERATPWTATPVLLETARASRPTHAPLAAHGAIAATINGRRRQFAPEATGKTLLDALREDGGLTGTKEGCAEGECGACTVWLDGQAVMSCLVPAAQAHGAAVTTIEGLADGEVLHPLQQAFIDHAAVQCGYCIPGMLMAGAKLLEEHAAPTRDAARVALSGNLCRCTGYTKILEAVAAAAASGGRP